MNIAISISDLRDYMISQVRSRNFYYSFICYAVEGYVRERFDIILQVDDIALEALSKWFGFPLESGNAGIDPNFTYEQLFDWMNLGWRVIDDPNLHLPDTYDVYNYRDRMLCRIGMLTWLMETNGIPGEAEIVITTEE